ncbi:SsrA-binding protein SmpB [Spirochaeta lutea]|uniref:SsrA-binding protein n=1 Tax=Spirochaeta lutea TaxID=1480694 RepID=A0A098R0I5_9SPIO|nr:SsrA-binding protein SmpB [Spirochaeta lutea]KGE73675.1 SsrA-binding protein [Spirochaeta lutea]
MALQAGKKLIGKNRKAFHNYHVEETLECGIALQGTEVKSLRANHFNFSDAYARIIDNELWLLGLHINTYDQGNIFNHDPDRKRKLLVHRSELAKLRKKVEEKGFTLIPLAFLLSHGLVKIELGICRGKKNYDKRQDIKQKDIRRESERELRGRF